MQPAKTLADIFQDRPERWGMRGDPHLWREMHAALGSSAYPSTRAAPTARWKPHSAANTTSREHRGNQDRIPQQKLVVYGS
jgi:hypothetical protein